MRATAKIRSAPDAQRIASAALESRAHPFVLVNPGAGDHAAERVSFGGNPQSGSDWPIETLEYRNADGLQRFLDELPQEDLEWEGQEDAPVEVKAARGNDALAAMRAMLKK